MAWTSPPATSLLALAERNAALHPHRLAVAGPSERLTWAELQRRSDAIAAAIEHFDLPAGDRVCLNLPSAPVWVAAFLALRRLGLTAVSIGNRARPAELDALLARFDVGLVVTDSPVRTTATPILDVTDLAEAASPPTRRTHDAALIHLTSGSSGMPKGVLRTEADLTEEARNVAEALGLSRGDAVLCATPVYHSFASGLLMACLHSATPCLLMDRLAPATLLDMALRERATIIAGVPYVFQTLTAVRNTLGSLPCLRLGISGGAHLQPETARRFQQRFGAPLAQEYGLSEAGIVTFNLDGPSQSAGAPIPNVALRIVDPATPSCDLPPDTVGEIVVKRAHPASEYIDHRRESLDVFTLYGIRTGDLGSVDTEGRLKLTGRIKEMINVAGAKVAPREVEDMLLTHPAIAEAVVLGLPGGDLEETVVAVVVPGPGNKVAEQELRAHCRERLSAYKVPACIHVLPDLPRTASGKPDVTRLRQDFSPRRQP
jgi:long-chain acyl-CoA synthetase